MNNDSIITYLKSNEFKRIFYTTHSINREKDGYNLTFNFLMLHFIVRTVFSIDTFLWVGGRTQTRKSVAAQIISLYIIHRFLGKKSVGSAFLWLSIFIVILFSLKQLRKSIMSIFSRFSISYACITCLSIRSWEIVSAGMSLIKRDCTSYI